MKTSTLVSRLVEASGKGQRKRLLTKNRDVADVALARALKDECYRVWTAAPAKARRVAEALKILTELVASSEIAAMHLWVEGIADITRGRLESAVENLDQASTLLARAGRKHESAQPQVAKLIALAMLGRYEQAQAAGRKALRIFEKFGDQLAAGKVEMNLSNVVSRRDQYRLAEKYCLSAFRRFRRLGEPAWQTMAENGLANTYAELNDFKRAERFYGSALERARANGMNLTVAEIEASIGNLALFRGRYADALRSLERSRQMYEALAMPHQTAIAELEIADIYAETNLNHEAIEIYRRIIPPLRRLKLRSEEARAHANFGKALLAIGDHRNARSELKRAADLFLTEKNAVAAASVDLQRAALESAQQKLSSALAIARSVSRRLNRSDNKRLRLSATWLRGDLLARTGNLKQAKALLEEACEEAKESDQPQISQAAMNSLGKLASELGDAEQAARLFSAAIESAELARDPLPGEEFRMAFLAKTIEPYQNLARLYLTGGRIEDAFVAVERARARSLLEGVEGARSAASSSASDIRVELNRYYALADRASDDEREGIEKEIRKREKRLAALTLREQSVAGRRHLKRDGLSIDLKVLQRTLGDSRALVEFVVEGNDVGAFVVSRERVEFVPRFADLSEVMKSLEGLHFQFGSLRFGLAGLGDFASQLKARADVYLQKLYQQLLQPLVDHIQDYLDLVIIPAGGLNYVPFNALHNGREYLIESRVITSSPSAGVWLRLNSRSAANSGRSLVIGFADSKIPLVNDEVKAVAASLPDSTALMGDEATFDAFRSTAPRSRVIHLACHGHFRPDNPMFSSLHLADGWVTVRDVCSTRLSAELVTLSACETGLSKVYAGDEVLGLARGFLSAGARSLVLSLWSVNDESTSQLMIRFYENLQRGTPVPASLIFAQRELINRGQHPYFWSPFFAIA